MGDDTRRFLERRAPLPMVFTAWLGVVGGCHQPQSAPRDDGPCHRIVILPGIANTTVQMSGLVRVLRERYPAAAIEVRPWGRPLASLANLFAGERNLNTAAAFAAEFTAHRRAHPQGRFDLVGFSGGGAMALFILETLPPDVQLDRVVVMAPAITPDYDLRPAMAHLRGMLVHFRSVLDLQVGWGTALLGTLDRTRTVSAGSRGFDQRHPQLLEIPWSVPMMLHGHFGNHLAYLLPTWQRHYVAPALDAELDAAALRVYYGQ